MSEQSAAQYVSRAEFARLQGDVSRSTVKRWADAGRLVLVDGKVDVGASRQRLADTQTGARPDMAARHAAARLQKNAKQAQQAASAAPGNAPDSQGDENPANTAPDDPPPANSLIAIRTRKEAVQLEMAEMERDQKRGELMPRAEVTAAMDDLIAFVRQGLDNMPHAVAGSLVGLDFTAIHATLRDHIATLMRDMHAQAQRELVELSKGEQAA